MLCVSSKQLCLRTPSRGYFPVIFSLIAPHKPSAAFLRGIKKAKFEAKEKHEIKLWPGKYWHWARCVSTSSM